jgi:hypothetical protein
MDEGPRVAVTREKTQGVTWEEKMSEGPKVQIIVTCSGCEYHSNEYYCVEDGNDCDSGFYNYCLLLDPHVEECQG